MRDVYWKSTFPQAYQKVRQIPLARNLPPAQWMFLSLESGFLNSEDHLTWARPFYGLASLENIFFVEHFTPETYEKYKAQFNWGPQVLPVFEWDGVVFVACVDPHSVPSHLEVVCRPLLASYEGLIRGWEIVTSNETFLLAKNHSPHNHTAEPAKMMEDAPPMMEDAPPMMEDAPPMMEDAPPMMEDAPPMMEDAPPMVEDAPPMMEDAPPMMEDILSMMEAAPVLVSDFDFSTSSPSPTLSVPKSEDLFELEDSAPNNESNEHKANGGEHNGSEAVFEMPEGLNFSPKPAVPVAPEQAINPPSIVQPPPEMELEEDLKLSFAKAYQSYRNLMILKLSNDAVIPFRWDPSYKNPKALKTIELNQPSVFRIAAKTQKPFHGAIAPNEVNSQFFANWFGGHTPTYLTIIPLFFERDCVGLLLGAADEELDRKDSLQLMESTAHNVEANFGPCLAS